MTEFILDSRLARDSHPIERLSLCELRLMDNSAFPWLLLIPAVAGLREWIDLSRTEQHQLSDEITRCSHLLKTLYSPDKLNIATLGNQVPQLHVHVIARYTHDAAWPNPVWGIPAEPYSPEACSSRIREMQDALCTCG